jgi:hypothetical protein
MNMSSVSRGVTQRVTLSEIGDAFSGFVTLPRNGLPTQSRNTRHQFGRVTHRFYSSICRPFARTHRENNRKARHHASPEVLG